MRHDTPLGPGEYQIQASYGPPSIHLHARVRHGELNLPLTVREASAIKAALDNCLTAIARGQDQSLSEHSNTSPDKPHDAAGSVEP